MAKEQQSTAGYYMVIPSIIWGDTNLTKVQILLYGHIATLANKNGYCYATNEYFSKQLGVSKTTVSTGISKLQRLGHIISEIIYNGATKQVDIRKIYIKEHSSNLNTPITTSLNTPITTSLNTPITTSLKDNTIKVNSIKNNNTGQRGSALVKGTKENIVLFKLWEHWPANKRGHLKNVAPVLEDLTIEELKLTVANLKRYLSVMKGREKFIVGLKTYLENRCFSNEWLEAEEGVQNAKTKFNAAEDRKITGDVKGIPELIKQIKHENI